MSLPPWMSVKEVVELTGWPASRIRKMCENGSLTAKKWPGRNDWYIDSTSLTNPPFPEAAEAREHYELPRFFWKREGDEKLF